MLPPGFVRIDGALNIAFGVAQGEYAGVGERNGAAVVSVSLPDHFPNGIPVVSATRGLAIVDYPSLVPPTTVSNGMLLDANGRLVTVSISAATTPLVELQGYTFDANGALLLP